MNDHKDIKTTLGSKVIGLFASFGLVILSTKIWGATGRGYISILLADAALIVVLANLLAGSSAMYYMKKFGQNKVFFTSLFWILISSLIGSGLLTLFQPLNFWLLGSLSFAISFHTLVVNQLFVNQNFSKANIVSAFVQLLFLGGVFAFWLMKLEILWEIYFVVQIVSSVFISLFFTTVKFEGLLSKQEIYSLFQYGWRNELSYIFQFLSYRISYFFIYQSLSVSDLGVFGVIVIFAESIWVASRSISTVLFAKQLEEKGEREGLQRVQKFAFYSFWISLAGILIIVLLPDTLIIKLLAKEFASTKLIFCILAPGILAIAVSNIYGHFFAAENNQSILIKKSIVGFLVAIVLTPIFINEFGLIGATAAMSLSYLVSSAVLIVAFYKRRKNILGKTHH
ncbi:MAG: polysaccharide biosynthesis C-terminal domain-containing protein [Bacteroidota bacterium]